MATLSFGISLAIPQPPVSTLLVLFKLTTPTRSKKARLHFIAKMKTFFERINDGIILLFPF